MGINIMNFLKCATLAGTFAIALPALADEAVYDLEKIELVSGRTYHGILILGADEHGLTFRHGRGAAKVPFAELSPNLRMLYEPVSEVPQGGGESDTEYEPEGPPREDAGVRAEGDALAEWKEAGSVEVLARSRVTFTYPIAHVRRLGRYACDPALLPGFRAPWKPHWGRYPRALSLANPAFREWAVRDFLVATGLAPTPPGVRVYSIPRRVPCSLHRAPLPW